MTRYIIRRGIQSIFLVFITTIISFTIYQLAPGGPIQFLEDDPGATTEDIERLTELYGLNRSIPVQYLVWLVGEDWLPNNSTWRSGLCMSKPTRCVRGLVRLDFGRSTFFKGEAALDVIAERIPATFTLALTSLVLSVVGGIPLGIYAALHRGKLADHVIRVSTILGNTVPHWWLGLLLLILFGGYLRLVPLGGMQRIGDGSILDRLHHLILPAMVGAIGGWISFSRILRFEVLDVLSLDYVRTARAKGLSNNAVLYGHVLRNAILPFVTGLGGIFLLAFSGSILFELVFSWPGMGRLAVISINSRDFPVMMALFVITSFLGIVGKLTVDILYSFVDPRVKYDIAK